MHPLAILNRARKDAELILDGCGWGRVPDWDTHECRDAYDARREVINAIGNITFGRGTVAERFERYWAHVAAKRANALSSFLSRLRPAVTRSLENV